MQKGLLRNICLWLYMIQTGGIKLMWTCNSNKKPSPDKRSNSNTDMKNLKGNCTHEHKCKLAAYDAFYHVMFIHICACSFTYNDIISSLLAYHHLPQKPLVLSRI